MAGGSPDTLAALRLALAPEIARAAVFDGWSDAALASAAEMTGTDPALARLAFPGGAMDMIAAFVESVDAAMLARFADGSLDAMKIRERISALVWFRLDHLLGMEEAISRALAIQAMPQNAARALKLGWHSADVMWRLAGDTATDYNHYTKRAILAGIYAAALAVYVNDESEGKADSRAFLARRIDGVMRFEKAKAKWLGKDREHFDVARFVGRLRYSGS
ncbi:COQ9 family protein [Alteraurantiacibacter buctensis]|uniref:COQ9 family protein n=1 Tax=Alteraurantiacibacter buctensis TaxID=1503981 RepID=A0A844Z0Z7_9SPHN|nr:COQ9 family protein [Alteraurantiacibacter buctensis]MXO73479.1 COQ9 family protein [Alteraurantiacibacter buctensis]